MIIHFFIEDTIQGTEIFSLRVGYDTECTKGVAAKDVIAFLSVSKLLAVLTHRCRLELIESLLLSPSVIDDGSLLNSTSKARSPSMCQTRQDSTGLRT